MWPAPTVWIIDDDPLMRASLVCLLRSAGHDVETDVTLTELLEHCGPDRPGCLLLDLQLSKADGAERWRLLCERGCSVPFIVMSGRGNVSLAVESMHLGAVDFMEKPLDHERLLQRIDLALRRDSDDRQRRFEDAEFYRLLASLTPREHQVMELVADGMLSKQVAKRLGISNKTVEVHRSHITKKMHVNSWLQLVRLLTKHSMVG